MSKLDQFAELVAKSSKGTWHSHTENYEKWHEAVAWYDRAHSKGKGPVTHFVLIDEGDADGNLVPAVTGNGSTSKANADFIASSRQMSEKLIAVARAAIAYNKQHTGGCRAGLDGKPCSCGVNDLFQALSALESN